MKKLLILSALFVAGCTEMNTEVLNIGHRGARGHVAENTIASIEKAFELGADGIEIDVFRCKSGEIVLMHDETINRTTNGEGHIEDLNIFQIMQLTVEEAYKVPQLQEVLRMLNGKLLNIELKGKNTASKVAHILNYYIEKEGLKSEQILISSFDWDELRSFREKNQDIAIGVLTEKDPLQALEVAKELKAKAIHPNHKLLTQENVSAIKEAGFEIFTWTVNEPADIARVKALGVEAIISDYPERVNAN